MNDLLGDTVGTPDKQADNVGKQSQFQHISWHCLRRARGSWRLLCYVNLLTYLLTVSQQNHMKININIVGLHGSPYTSRQL